MKDLHVSTKLFILMCFVVLCAPTSIRAAVLINEFSSYDSTGDWVEIYSNESSDVDISGWYLKDSNKSSVIGTAVPANTKLTSTNRYYVFEVGDRLNVNKDTIFLFKSDNSEVNNINYGDTNTVCAPNASGQTIGRYEDGGNLIDRFSVGTKGASNAGGTKMPCPSPTPVPQNTNTHTPTVTSNPTNTPTVTAAPTKTPTPKPTKTPTPEEDEEEQLTTPTDTPAQVLGTTSDVTETQSLSPTPVIESQSEKKIPLPAYFFIGGGVITMGAAGFLFFKNKKKYNN